MNTERIDNILNKYLEKFEATASIDNDFWVNIGTNEIHYALTVSDKQGEYFKEFCHSINPYVNADLFILSLFHEIFHLETYDDLDDSEIDYSEDMKAILTGETKEQCFDYFLLPDEYAATSAALDYIEEHASEVRELWHQLKPEILRFYAENDLH